jgi:hypothetical protein
VAVLTATVLAAVIVDVYKTLLVQEIRNAPETASAIMAVFKDPN